MVMGGSNCVQKNLALPQAINLRLIKRLNAALKLTAGLSGRIRNGDIT